MYDDGEEELELGGERERARVGGDRDGAFGGIGGGGGGGDLAGEAVGGVVLYEGGSDSVSGVGAGVSVADVADKDSSSTSLRTWWVKPPLPKPLALPEEVEE
jgi:hypothetical protein